MNSRKGSMQLSIEAIIILVIAFVLLGLGIVFVKNFFTKAGTSTNQYIDQAGSACNTATSDNPITPTKFQIKQGGNSNEEICVLNNADKPITNGRLQILSCIGPDGSAAPANAIQIVSAPLPSQQRGESKSFKTTVKAPNAVLGTYICNIALEKDSATSSDPSVGPIQITVEVV